MTFSSKNMVRPLSVLLVGLFVGMAALGFNPAQEKKVAQMNGVDNTKMGAYRALAQHIYGDFQRAAAAELSRVLERIWDKAEYGIGEDESQTIR